MATPKNIWNNSAEMHEIIANESPEYFEAPEEQYLNFEEHCHDCYWCIERLVTYGKTDA